MGNNSSQSSLEPGLLSCFKHFSDASFEALFFSEDGICIAQNRSAQNMFGYTDEEAVGRPGTDWIHPDYHSIVKCHLRSGNDADPYEVVALRKDGSSFVCEIQARMADVDGRAIRITSLRDISARKKAEAALVKSEHKWRHILINSPQMGISLDPQGKIIFANDHFLELTGWQRDEVIGKDWFETFIHESIRDEIGSVFKTVMAQKHEHGFSNYENDILHRNGGHLTIAWSNVLTLDVNGYVEDVTCLGVDLTQRRRAEKAIRESEERFRLLAENARDLIYRMAVPDGVYEYVSPASQGILGYSPEEFISNPMLIRNLIHQDWREYLEENWKLVCDGRGLDSFEFKIIHKNGEEHWLSQRNVYLKDDSGKVYAMEGIVTDITERKHAEEKAHQAEAFLTAAMDRSPAGIAIAEAPSGKLKYVNKAALGIRGGAEAELVDGVSVDEYVQSWQILHFDGTPYETEEVPLARAILFGETCDRQFILRRPDQEERIVWAHAAPIYSDSGELIAGIVVFPDITDLKKVEIALKDSEERLKLAAESGGLGLWDWRVDLDRAIVSDQWLKIKGLTREKFEKLNIEHWHQNIHPEDIDRATALLERHLNGEIAHFECEYRFNRPGHGWYWEQAAARVIERDSNGKPIRMLGYHQDISDRKQAELRLQESENRFQLAMNASQDGLFDWNLVTNEIYYSPGWKKMLGYEDDELPNDFSVWETATDPEDVKRSWTMLQELINKQRDRFEIEFKMKHKDDHWVDILSRATAVFDESGTAVRIVGTHVDITERKCAAEALRKSEATLLKVFEILPIGLWFADKTGKLLRGNPAGQRIWGAEPKVGMEEYGVFTARRYPSGEELKSDEWALAKSILHGATIVDEMLEIDAFDGVKRIILNYTAPLKGGENNIEGAIVVNNDITDLIRTQEALHKAKEHAEAANMAKSEFLANMSHEIRTPLSGLMGMLQLLKMTNQDTEQGEYTEQALQSSRRLLRLLSDILDIAKVEAGKLSLVLEPLDFQDVIDSVVQLFSPVAMEKQVDLKVHINPEIPSTLLGDAARLQQVLSNLVGNAIKFTSMGHVDINAHPLSPRKQDEYHVLFSVSDTGIGMSDELVEKLFVPFTQGEQNYKRSFQGAGLGLSISKRLVELMGGNMAVESEEGVGSTLYFCIRFKRAEHGSTARSIEGKRAELTGRKVVVVDDDETSKFIALKCLEKAGHQVVAVEDGEQALAVLKEEPFDLVLMDVQMPVLDGVEATNAIRRGDAGQENKDIPIIAMTAYAMTGDKEKLLEAGMNGYVAKPVEIEELQKVMSHVLEKIDNPH